ncbi:MAG: hypothetical protein IH840_10300 [Candidatus Heimdallarchaeota archaeon]|nr:hypothetical protein [Candidatus Heimdallarchaeota archaeon]
MSAVPQHIRSQEILPETTTAPIIDGNVTTIEWVNSLNFSSIVAGKNASVFVTSLNDNLYIGFNTTTDRFILVNNTLPDTAENTNDTNGLWNDRGVDYNNATHDWFMLQIDNNLDRESIGTESSPDDAIIIDQYDNSSYDGYLNGNSTHPTNQDLANNGTNDGNAVRLNYTLDDQEYFSYEFQKPLNQLDTNGSDFLFDQSKVLQFRFTIWSNQTANATIDQGSSSEWFSMRINETGTGFALKDAINTTLSITLSVDEAGKYNALTTILEHYQFSVNARSISEFGSDSLNIVIFGSGSNQTQSRMKELAALLSLGGTALIFASADSTGQSNLILDELNVEFLPNQVLTLDDDGNKTSKLVITEFNSDLPFIEGNTSITNEQVNALTWSTAGFNISSANNLTAQRYFLSQEYRLYDLFELPPMTVYDANNDGNISDGETNFGLSVGFAVDLLKGGRIVVLPSSSMLENDNIIQADNIDWLLRLIPWNNRIVNTLQIHSTKLNRHVVEVGDSIKFTNNVTDEFGNSLGNINVDVQIVLVGNTIISATPKQIGTSSIYEAEITVDRNGHLNIESFAFALGYGFIQGQILSIISERQVGSFNDLSDLSLIMSIIFLATIGLIVITLKKASAMAE